MWATGWGMWNRQPVGRVNGPTYDGKNRGRWGCIIRNWGIGWVAKFEHGWGGGGGGPILPPPPPPINFNGIVLSVFYTKWNVFR